MTTLDLEDLRRDIIKFVLNSELFYTFQQRDYLALLKKIKYLQELHPDLHDLIKTVQIQLSIQEKDITELSLEQLARFHQDLPVLNPQFLTFLLKNYNMNKLLFNKQIVNPFNLNISLMNLPSVNYQPLIEEYNLALVNFLGISSPEQMDSNRLMRLLSLNAYFARYGFYQGFTDILFAALLSDDRAKSDLWLLSTLNKIISLDCTDQSFYLKIKQLLQDKFEKYLHSSFLKLVSLVSKVCPENEKMRETLLRRSRLVRPELVQDQKVVISLC